MPNEPAPSPASGREIDVYLKQRRLQRQGRGRLVLGLDATASRQPTWDSACTLQAKMYEEAIGLEMQGLCYRGQGELKHSNWTTNPRELAKWMSAVTCKGGTTQIIRVLEHIREEHRRKPVTAAVFVGDAKEGDEPGALYDAATGLGVRIFWFQEEMIPRPKKSFASWQT